MIQLNRDLCFLILSFFLFAFAPLQIYPQEQFTIDYLNNNNGLSSLVVHQTINDKYGFLWIATRDGLNKYDGYNFTTYKHKENDKYSISGNDVSSLCLYDYKIWAGTWGNGINEFNNNKFISFKNNTKDTNSISSNNIQFLFRDKSNHLWICTQAGLDRFEQPNKNFRHFIRNKHILSIAEDSDETIYAGGTEYLFTIDKSRKVINRYYFPHVNIFSICSDHKGVLWIGTDKGLLQFDKQKKEFITLDWHMYMPYDTDNILVKYIFEDSNNNLWFATMRDGIFYYDRKTNKITRINSSPENRLRVTYDFVYHLYEDNNKIVWVSTYGGGLNKIDLKEKRFKIFTHNFNNPRSIDDSPVYCFYEDKYNTLWIGTLTGLIKFDRNSEEIQYVKFPIVRGLPIKIPVRSICEIEPDIFLFGTYRDGVIKFNFRTKEITKLRNEFELPQWELNSQILSIIKDKKYIWIVSEAGLIGLNALTRKLKIYSAELGNLPANRINSFLKDTNGIFWIGTTEGLIKLNPATGMNNTLIAGPGRDNLSANNILSLCEYKDHILVGTTTGLDRIDKNTGNIEKYNNIYNHNIQKIQLDNNENLWLAINDGLLKLDMKTNSLKKYDKYNGLPSEQFAWRSSFITKDGELFFGNSRGFLSFYTDKLKQVAKPPAIVLSSFKVFNESKKLDSDISEIGEITLQHNENRISFCFTALDFSAPERNRFKYKLVGFDKNWILADEKRTANYMNLEPGNYTFVVIGSNSDNVWNETGASVNLTVVPPLWRAWWFRISSALALTIFVFVGYRVKIRSIEKSRITLQQLNDQLLIENKERKLAEHSAKNAKEHAEKSEKLKSEFLAQMSHEIRSPINTIFNFMELLKEDCGLHDDDEKNLMFEAMERAGERIIRTIDLILNMSEVQTGSYECTFKNINLNKQILAKIHTEFIYKARKKNLELIFLPSNENIIICADFYSVDQIIANLVDNAIKYTQKGKVVISSYLNDSKAYVKISDTGIGISAEYLPDLFIPFSQEEQGYTRRYEGSGLGLSLVKNYCEMNHAEISVSSEKGTGTEFTVCFDLNFKGDIDYNHCT